MPVLLPGKLLRYTEMSDTFRNRHKQFTITRINTPCLVCWEFHKLGIKMINEILSTVIMNHTNVFVHSHS